MSLSTQRSRYSLEEIIAAVEAFNDTYGFVNYAEIGRRLGLSRQAIQLRIKAARTAGLIDDLTHTRLRPPVRTDRVSIDVRIAPEARDFAWGLAERLEVHPATVVEAAILNYKQSLRDELTLLPVPQAS